MSVQFGRWNFDGQPVEPEYIEKSNALLAPYGPDGCSSQSARGVTVVYHAFHTTKESRREKQPHISNSGAVITWDGRLDNRSELIRELANVLTASPTDVEIAAAAYEEWGEKSFAKLIGDWAIAIWNPVTRSLTLAKDVIGTRHLYYAVEESRITWSTILDPLVLLAGRQFQLCEEYIAGWLGFFPAAHLTPYGGIDSVPPSSFVQLQPGKREIRKYWDFYPQKRIRYRTDGEYEEHFRIVFAEAVRRRLRSDSPILAELSGGMDSSSIVCMADAIIARGMAETPRLDTLSYYDDSEPNWNERPYFTKVEQQRGRCGCHVELISDGAFDFPSRNGRFAPTPGSKTGYSRTEKKFAACLASGGNRVLLSGIGGDEVLGGVPTATPELADLISRGRFSTLARQLALWALSKRKPWLRLLIEAVREFFPPALVGVPALTRPASWIAPGFVERRRLALTGYRSRLRLFGPLPSFQENVSTLEALRRQLGSSAPPAEPTYEKRFPYLDHGLLNFIFAIPREQLLRPHQRRSLMRRSVAGIVPDEIRNRRRKAFAARSPISAIVRNLLLLKETGENLALASLGIVDATSFLEALQRAGDGKECSVVTCLRTLTLEFWLRGYRCNTTTAATPPHLGVTDCESQGKPRTTGMHDPSLAGKPNILLG